MTKKQCLAVLDVLIEAATSNADRTSMKALLIAKATVSLMQDVQFDYLVLGLELP